VNAGPCNACAKALIFGLILGCQASVNADAHVSGKGTSAEADADLRASGDGEGQGEMTRSATASPGNGTAAMSGNPSRVLLGARHDLKLQPGKGNASCECLSIALGGTHSDGMAWSATAPEIDDSSQLSIAFSSASQACKGEPKNSLGASYWGYRLRGNDVVVVVEAAGGGRPMTSGAIIPKPVGAGQVYVAPASKRLPYGRPLQGQGLCKIGNPGQVRSAAFTELEVGTKAPAATSHSVTRQPNRMDTGNDTPATIEMPSN